MAVKNKKKLQKQEQKQREELRRLKELIPTPTHTDGGWGTLKPDKTEMEEARRVICIECGCGEGRHLRVCSKA